jgi:hypothetical protein
VKYLAVVCSCPFPFLTLIIFSFFKVGFFRFSRTVLVEQANQSHHDATEHYREAKDFAKWSAKDRAERRASLPPLTPEQAKQMRAYLRVMQEHHAFNPDSEQQSD